MTNSRFRRLYPPAAAPEGAAYWLLFRGDELLMVAEAVPALLEGTSAAPVHVDGALDVPDGLGECLLAFHHPRAGEIAELFDLVGCDRRHVFLCAPQRPPAPAGADGRWVTPMVT